MHTGEGNLKKSVEGDAVRSKLKLLSRSAKNPINEVAYTSNRSSIFGDANPRDDKKFKRKTNNDLSENQGFSQKRVIKYRW